MSNVSYAQALSILRSWIGTTAQKYRQWDSTYDNVVPPPSPAEQLNDEILAQYIADHYTGPPIPTGTE
jgi:hypothetical protein